MSVLSYPGTFDEKPSSSSKRNRSKKIIMDIVAKDIFVEILVEIN